jgi:hypothetical protein
MGLVHVVRRTFIAGRPYPGAHQEYFTDLLASYGMSPRPGAFDAGRTSYQEMVAAMMPELVPLAAGFDLAVLAHASPDAEPGWPMCYLADAVPAAGLAFAISDQGATAPFTALRLVLDSAWANQARLALVLIMGNAAVLHDGPVPESARVTRDRAVALVLREGADLVLESVRQLTCVPAQSVRARLDDALREVGGPLTAIFGQGLAGHVDGQVFAERVRWAAPGQPGTGIWSLLAQPQPDAPGCVVLGDYDAELQYLSLSVFRRRECVEATRSLPGGNRSLARDSSPPATLGATVAETYGRAMSQEMPDGNVRIVGARQSGTPSSAKLAFPAPSSTETPSEGTGSDRLRPRNREVVG